MPIVTVPETTGSSLGSLMSSRNIVFIVPTMQRPFAWEERQIDDLLRDIENASTSPIKQHYFAPIHLLSLTPNNASNLQRYLPDHDDLDELRASNFIDDNGFPLKVYLLIDGQQRLTSFYFLFHQFIKNLLYVTLRGGHTIPRLLLGSTRLWPFHPVEASWSRRISHSVR